MTENISYIHVRIWFKDGEYLEKTFNSDYDVQWSLTSGEGLMAKHGLIETIIIDTEW